MIKVNQSAAKPLNSLEQEESSQTIPKGSTFVNKTSGSGSPSACNDGGDDIVENKFINSFINKSILNNENRIYKKWSTELFNIDIYESIKNIFI